MHDSTHWEALFELIKCGRSTALQGEQSQIPACSSGLKQAEERVEEIHSGNAECIFEKKTCPVTENSKHAEETKNKFGGL